MTPPVAAVIAEAPVRRTANYSVERQALLFDDGEVVLAAGSRPEDLARLWAEWESESPPHLRPRRARVLLTVLDVEPRPVPVALPTEVVDILRRIRDTPNLDPAFRRELDAVLSGAAR